MTSQVTIQLSQDEALVLSVFFGRFEQERSFRLRHNAEFVAFVQVAAQLDKALVNPFQHDYAQQVEAARLRLADGYEGIAPGVEPIGQT